MGKKPSNLKKTLTKLLEREKELSVEFVVTRPNKNKTVKC